MKRINTRAELIEFAAEIGMRSDWHEPDEKEITVVMRGDSFDNAGFWPAPNTFGGDQTEIHALFFRTAEDPATGNSVPTGKPLAAVNLATLFAWATGFDN